MLQIERLTILSACAAVEASAFAPLIYRQLHGHIYLQKQVVQLCMRKLVASKRCRSVGRFMLLYGFIHVPRWRSFPRWLDFGICKLCSVLTACPGYFQTLSESSKRGITRNFVLKAWQRKTCLRLKRHNDMCEKLHMLTSVASIVVRLLFSLSQFSAATLKIEPDISAMKH